MAALEVYKTSRASTPAGGMGATINVRTQRPFDIKDTIAQVGVKLVNDKTASNLPAELKGDKATPELVKQLQELSKANEDLAVVLATEQVR